MAVILVISPCPTHPQNVGNRIRVYNQLSFLRAEGHDIHYLHIGRTAGDTRRMTSSWAGYTKVRFRRPARGWYLQVVKFAGKAGISLPIPVWDIDDWYHPAYDRAIDALKGRLQIEIVIVNYVFFSKALCRFGDEVLKVIDTHDVFSDRHLKFLANNQHPTFFFTSQLQEARGLNRADVIMAIQENERTFYAKLTDKPVLTVGHLLDMPPHLSGGNRDADRTRLLFVGSRNSINRVALLYFIQQILPILQADHPTIELSVAGSICRDRDIKRVEVKKWGVVDDLATVYRQSDIVINPIKFGSGLKIKNIEAMSFGMPVVTTTVGAEGMEEGIGRALLVGDTPDDFAKAVRRLLTDAAFYDRVSADAYAFSMRYNTENLDRLRSIIDRRF